MILPSKLFSYNQSILALFPKILNELAEPTSPNFLFTKLKLSSAEILTFSSALDALYALGAIKLNDGGELEKC